MIYSLLLEDHKQAAEAREKLDERLDSMRDAGRPDRATWGKLPHQQRQMRRAAALAKT